ncbi:hypothetical protein Q9L58_007824 [Maublancomyces gigas]|uniref:Uncharacterized protein n=1 Tax=Discina gigas TaxID=1032678 RepID=A0ABR3GBU4_9PEZI
MRIEIVNLGTGRTERGSERSRPKRPQAPEDHEYDPSTRGSPTGLTSPQASGPHDETSNHFTSTSSGKPHTGPVTTERSLKDHVAVMTDGKTRFVAKLFLRYMNTLW